MRQVFHGEIEAVNFHICSFLEGIVRVGVFSGGKCPRGNSPGMNRLGHLFCYLGMLSSIIYFLLHLDYFKVSNVWFYFTLI